MHIVNAPMCPYVLLCGLFTMYLSTSSPGHGVVKKVLMRLPRVHRLLKPVQNEYLYMLNTPAYEIPFMLCFFVDAYGF
jgi:hypothetical protein